MRKKAFGGLIVLVIGVLATAFLLLIGNKERAVSVSNQSKNYVVTYKENKMFSDLLDKWGVWSDKKISIENTINAYTAKRVKIVVTDEPQKMFKVIDKSTPPIAFAASGVQMDKDTLVVNVYFNKERLAMAKPKEFGYLKDINGFLLWIVLDALYTSTHMTGSRADLEETTFQINSAINDLRNDNSDPFTIRSK